MRFVIRDYSNKPSILTLKATKIDWNNIAKTGNTTLIKTQLYSDPYKNSDGIMQSKVIDKLSIWYYGKCAYCERRYKLDVEHYRPKGRIKDENGALISNSGYYWLCYEWSNLLPSCISCNREGGKLDKFPILGTRISSPKFTRSRNLSISNCKITKQHFIDENPYLLNPEIDNPDKYLAFQYNSSLNGIKIIGIDKENRGDITQKICLLNRPEIQIERGQVILEFSEAVHSAFKLYQNGNRTATQFVESINELLQSLYDKRTKVELTHIFLRNYIVANDTNFKAIVLPYITSAAQAIVLTAFQTYSPI